jgi:MFS family permease
VTVVFAMYALGVILSLFLGGHVSDWLGRRPVIVQALLVLSDRVAARSAPPLRQ